MIDKGKQNIIGVLVDGVDYESAVENVMQHAAGHRPFAVSALAVHGVMTGYLDDEHRARLNQLDLVVPDGQPVRWAMNALHGAGLRDRVYGPTLMRKVCQRAAQDGVGIYLYGSTADVIQRLQRSLSRDFPGITICGAEPSKFRRISQEEKDEVVARIRQSGAQIVFVGLGCPRQEVWAYEYRDVLSMPILAVGAAFDFNAGTTQQAPGWMQARGLEWAYRLVADPRRLWRRYLILNPYYVALVALQLMRVRSFSPSVQQTIREISYG